MSDLNVVVLDGRVVRDSEFRSFKNGGGVVVFSVAVNKSRKDKNTGEWTNEPTFLDCKMYCDAKYPDKSNTALERIKKGSKILVKGSLEQENWTDKEGQKRSKIAVNVEQATYPPKSSTDGASAPASKGARAASSGSVGEGYDIPLQDPVQEEIPF